MTELSSTVPEYSENTDTEDKEETDIEEEAPIDSGRRKGRTSKSCINEAVQMLMQIKHS